MKLVLIPLSAAALVTTIHATVTLSPLAAFPAAVITIAGVVMAAGSGRTEPERDAFPISVMGDRYFEQRITTMANIRQEEHEPVAPDERVKRKLRLLIRNLYSDGKTIPRDGIPLGYRLLERYEIGRGDARNLRRYVLSCCGYETRRGEVVLAATKARAFLGRMAETERREREGASPPPLRLDTIASKEMAT